MTTRWLVATLHLLALPLGLGAIWARARALGSLRGTAEFPRVFAADNLWGLAAIVWIATGLLRAFGGMEKGTAYYLHDRVFYLKMGLFLAILLLEIRPMVTLIRWRVGVRRGTVPDLTSAPALARISQIQTALIVAMVCAATAIARGLFY
jgi:putative membrane protein